MQPSICPACSSENIPGTEICADCGAELSELAIPRPASPIESNLMVDTLAQLAPAAPVAVSPDTPVREAMQKMVEHGIGCVLVSEGGELFGIFSERDVLMRVADRPDELADKPVRDFMTAAPETLSHDAPIAFAVNRMAVGDYRHVPVIEPDGKRAGVVSVRDVIAYLCRKYPEIMGTTKPVS